MVNEALAAQRFPGIVFRDGPTGRRAGLATGPDVWEIVRDLQRQSAEADPTRLVVEETGLVPEQIALASDYYAVFPDEVDDRIALDTKAYEQLQRQR